MKGENLRCKDEVANRKYAEERENKLVNFHEYRKLIFQTSGGNPLQRKNKTLVV